jgi:hypothetical protein
MAANLSQVRLSPNIHVKSVGFGILWDESLPRVIITPTDANRRSHQLGPFVRREPRSMTVMAIFPNNPSCGMIAGYERFTMLLGRIQR